MELFIMQRMKTLLLFLILLVSSVGFAFDLNMTNGSFYIDNPVECRLVSQNGNTRTNQLGAGGTYMVGSTLLEMDIANKMTFYFAGGPIIGISSNAEFGINMFDQEVTNLNAQPRRAEFGKHDLSFNFQRGEFSIIYPNQNTNSTMIISTPFTMYQLSGGKYYFRVTDKSSIAYVLEGNMKVHGDGNRVDATDKGKLAMAVPFMDPASGLHDKIITSIKPLKPEEIELFSGPVLTTDKKRDDVQFIVVSNKVVGVWMK